MSARPDSWMPIYWGDYLRDTGHLSTEQHGAYLLLIGHYWTTGKPLLDNDAQLSRIARLPSAVWKRARDTIAAFFSITDGLWRHTRIDAELKKAGEYLERQAVNGRKGGRPKTQSKPTANPGLNPRPNPDETTSQPTPPSPTIENTPQQPSLDAARALKMREAKDRVSSILNSPSVTMFNRVDAWLEAGCDLERDIIPAIQSGLAKLNGSTVRSLSYFDGMVADAHAARTRPLPAGQSRAPSQQSRGAPGEYIARAPSASAEETRLKAYEDLIKKRINPGTNCSQSDIKRLLTDKRVTPQQIQEAGL